MGEGYLRKGEAETLEAIWPEELFKTFSLGLVLSDEEFSSLIL